MLAVDPISDSLLTFRHARLASGCMADYDEGCRRAETDPAPLPVQENPVAVSPSAATVENFSAAMTGDQTFQLGGRPAKYTVLYFYPKDNTPGCTTESMAFRDKHDEFLAAGAEVYGISRDSLRSHEGFKSKLGLPFELISDPEELVCNQFGVMKNKMMYGKQVRGVERSTFVV